LLAEAAEAAFHGGFKAKPAGEVLVDY